MSANNQHQQAEHAAAAVAAPSASSEYLKRTCLICGCHTNQTINIYEPRSGPNIVQLIQAKFKFQPLNEDKFLCFSCNNWLINWHSLQAVNSNEAESQSQSPSHMGNNSSSVLQQERTKLRPVAMVRPQVRVQPQSQPQPQPQVPATPAAIPITYAKRRSSRRSSGSASVSRMSRILRQCCLETLRRSPKKRSQQSVFVYLRSNQRRNNVLCKVQCVAPRRKPAEARLVKEAAAPLPVAQPSPNAYQRFPQPSVDGKVVAMFRRLGTTLSREEPPVTSHSSSTSCNPPRPPQIMSPAKERPRWSRVLDEDEVLLEFDSAISEVLPATTRVRRCLSYPVTNEEREEELESEVDQREEEDVEEEQEEDMEQELEVVPEQEAPLEPQSHHNSNSHQLSHQQQASIHLAGLRLPQGLSISLV
ncbi:uncharacterized protein Dana_GF11350 [Drosophila ananassae]|uniref:ZAD domain-containing protein n=1 Tax=Drosophila ananassae TaxID=7217 RepID=B3ME12_DROAN|nr:protein phyllopod [Drosophila ananassae]EDV37557.2 uncharacterized protein Dana_GF11350 [Drosophila ananassae]